MSLQELWQPVGDLLVSIATDSEHGINSDFLMFLSGCVLGAIGGGSGIKGGDDVLERWRSIVAETCQQSLGRPLGEFYGKIPDFSYEMAAECIVRIMPELEEMSNDSEELGTVVAAWIGTWAAKFDEYLPAEEFVTVSLNFAELASKVDRWTLFNKDTTEQMGTWPANKESDRVELKTTQDTALGKGSADSLVQKLRQQAHKEGISSKWEPLSPELVENVQKELDVKFPELFTRVYTTVANGFFGPGEMLLPLVDPTYVYEGELEEDYDVNEAEDIYSLYLGFIKPKTRTRWGADDDTDYVWEWTPGLVPICDWGDSIFTVLDCNVSDGLVLMCDVSDARINYKDAYLNKGAGFEFPGVPLAVWLASWLDGTQIKYMRGGERLSPEEYMPPAEDHMQGESRQEYWLRKKAEAGDVNSQYELALTYYDRHEGPAALLWLDKAATGGIERAKFWLALGHRDAEFGTEANWDKAYDYAHQVDSEISFYLDGPETNHSLKDIEPSYDSAVRWWKKRADGGDGRAAYSLGLALLTTNVDAANARFEQAAKLGYASAMRKIGKDYWNGENGRPFDEQEAIRWFKRAADAGSVLAMGDLAWYYSSKRVDWSEAIRFSKQVIEQPYERQNWEVVLVQLHRLGTAYMTGEIVEKNVPLAIQYYERASSIGDSDADYLIAILILKGYEIEGGVKRALALLRRASDKGHGALPEAQFKLAQCYEKGVGGEVNAIEASYWMQEAALQDFVAAQTQFARYLEEGFGVRQNLDQAIAWYSKASEAGDEEARLRLQSLQSF